MRKLLLLCSYSIALAVAPAHAEVPVVGITTSDVDRFYAIYDAAKGAPSAAILQRDYIDAGSDGVRQFVPNRIKSGEALSARIAQNKALYDHARVCAIELPAAKLQLTAALTRLHSVYPNAIFPLVTVLVGRDNSGGTTGLSGVLIGLEVFCRPDSPNGSSAEQLVHLITHEYAHVQQYPNGGDETAPTTVLKQSLIEGTAELVAEIASGRVANGHLLSWTRGHEMAIETAFLADADKPDISQWLYNGVGTREKPGDLGYWVGYRIAKAYYRKATDKRTALHDLIELKDPHAILINSGWSPGIRI